MIDVGKRVHAAVGEWPERIEELAGGCVGEVRGVEMPGGDRYVAKVDEGGTGQLETEGWMLAYLAEKAPELPFPRVVHCDAHVLLMEWLPGSTGVPRVAEGEAARLLAKLHGITADRCGLERDTAIGGLHQPNPWSDSWLAFFGEHRLGHMAKVCRDAGRIDARTVTRIERLAGRLGEYLDEPERPSLLHGDLWGGNVLTQGSRVTGLIDPAIYYGHPEAELAFVTLFKTCGNKFFGVYEGLRGLDEAEFMDVRRHVYNLYPLLVHVRLFGEAYLGDVQSVVARFG